MTLVEDIQQDYMKEDIPDFDVGDTIQVDVIISEGDVKRTQQFEGYVTARKGEGLNETFTVRKMVQGEGVERVFPLHSPKIDSIEKVRSGRVRRSKLYYLSEQKGKAAEIREDLDEEEEVAGTAATDEAADTDEQEDVADDSDEASADAEQDVTEQETESKQDDTEDEHQTEDTDTASEADTAGEADNDEADEEEAETTEADTNTEAQEEEEAADETDDEDDKA